MKDNWMIQDPDFYREMVTDFRHSATSDLATLASRLGTWSKRESAPTPEEAGSCFELVHRLKGAAGTLGLDLVEGPLRQLETMFAAARQDRIRLTPGFVKGLVSVVNQVNRLVEELDAARLMSSQMIPLRCDGVQKENPA